MTARLSAAQLDEILVLQLNVAWAGEAAGDPPRLGWWKSDLVDPEGGGDLFARLVPKTAALASLVLVREAARRVEAAALASFQQRDAMWTLFHFDFEIDEQLDDRLAFHRSQLRPPAEAFGPRFVVGKPWSREGFEATLAKLGKPKVETVPRARHVVTKVSSPVEACALLVAALLPLDREYPLPYVDAVTSVGSAKVPA